MTLNLRGIPRDAWLAALPVLVLLATFVLCPLAELARRGWREADLRKLTGENALRVLARAEQVAARLQRARPASTATIQQLDGAR